MMKLWLLTRIAPWTEVEWDSTVSMVVRATSERHARVIAAVAVKNEGGDFLDPGVVKCTRLTAKGKDGVIITNLKRG